MDNGMPPAGFCIKNGLASLDLVRVARQEAAVLAGCKDMAELTDDLCSRAVRIGALERHFPRTPGLANVVDAAIPFARELIGTDSCCFLGSSLTIMGSSYSYTGDWHRDFSAVPSVFRTNAAKSVQVLLALEEDSCLELLPGSQMGTGTSSPAMCFGFKATVPIGAGLFFNWKLLHRGQKLPGRNRISIFALFACKSAAREFAPALALPLLRGRLTDGGDACLPKNLRAAYRNFMEDISR